MKSDPSAHRRPLRACMVAYTFYRSDNRVRRYAEALAERGDRVDVLSLRRNGEPTFERMAGVNIYRIQGRERNERGRATYLRRLLRFFWLSSSFLCRRQWRGKGYDLIHVHSVPDFEVFAALPSKLGGAKVLLDIHDLVPEFYASKFRVGRRSPGFRLLKLMERMSAATADHVIISNHLWEQVLVGRSVAEEKCSTIMNYPDQLFFQTPRVRGRDGRFTFIYPGTLARHQGVDLAVRAFARVLPRMPSARLDIYGDGEEKEALAGLIGSLGLEGAVRLREVVPLEEIASRMGAADVGVVPKRSDSFGDEAFSTKILEFMAVGLPVLAAGTSIDRFYFSDEVVRFFEPGNEEALAEGMLELFRQEETRRRLVENSREFVRPFSWRERRVEYLELVDRLVDVGGEGRRPPGSEAP